MTEMQFAAAGPLTGTLRVPGDKSISHRAVLMAALAPGTSVVRGLSDGEDVAASMAAVEALGATIDNTGDGEVRITGGRGVLAAPERHLDAGNSGTSARLLAGLLASLPWCSTITGDESLCKRPMGRVVDPLRMMGAKFDNVGPAGRLPLTVCGAGLTGIEYHMPVRSGQVKSAILLAGLSAEGTTTVHEDVPTRAHTEEMLADFGADVSTAENIDGSCSISVNASDIQPFTHDVPGDPSQAAFWMVAASIVPDSDVRIENVYVGPARGGLIDVLIRMGADVELDYKTSTIADVRVRHSLLTATEIESDEIPSLVDELPVLAIAAARAKGITRVSGAGELRFKESDRIAALATEIAGLGVDISELPDGFSVEGRPDVLLTGGIVDARLDHRIAMTAAVAALVSSRPVTVKGWQAVATSYRGFGADLKRLRREH